MLCLLDRPSGCSLVRERLPEQISGEGVIQTKPLEVHSKDGKGAETKIYTSLSKALLQLTDMGSGLIESCKRMQRLRTDSPRKESHRDHMGHIAAQRKTN